MKDFRHSGKIATAPVTPKSSEPDHRRGSDAGGYYIRTFTGKQVYWDKIESNVYDIKDIAHALSCNCRWTGHTRDFYSVAQHSVYCSYEVPIKDAKAALLHDAAETYVHDTPSPLKWWLRANGFTTFKDLEDRILKEIYRQYGMAWPMPKSVKEADQRMLATEKRDLMPIGGEDSYLPTPYKWRVMPLAPRGAEQLFLTRYNEIKLWESKHGIHIV